MKSIQTASYIKYLAEVSGDEEFKKSPLKLQKLLYYCQGYSLAFLGTPLFSEKVLHWDNGPVVREVWQKTNKGAFLDVSPEETDFSDLTDDEKTIIEDVFKVYGRYAAWMLRNLTHSEDPWIKSVTNGEICQSSLLNFFTKKKEWFVQQVEDIDDLETLKMVEDEESFDYTSPTPTVNV